MSPNQENILIDHLDSHLQGSTSPELERLLAEDPEAAQQWERLLLAVEGLKEAGLYQQVGLVRETWKQQQLQSVPSPSNVRRIVRITLRAAAIVVLVVGGAVAFKYSTTNATDLYKDNYTSFQLGTTRGSEPLADELQQAYRQENWKGVVESFTHISKVDNQALFLTGIANLQLKHYDEAINLFQQVIAANFQSHSATYQEDAEYYLLLSWLARNNAREAMPLIDKIKADTHHAYHDKVMKLSSLDLWIARYKEQK